MQHLTLEELAGLVDEPGDDAAVEHLRECGVCAEELARMRDQTAALAGLRRATPPATLWPALEERLRAEGLVAGRERAGRGFALRAAAGIALFLLGSVAGGSGMRLSGAGAPPAPGTPGATADPALAAEELRAAEAAYLEAVARYAELSDRDASVDPVNRLAALEGILLTTGAALRDAPADPVINNYHLTALGLRDALIRQIEEVESEEWY